MSFSRFANKPVTNANLAQSTAERSVYPQRWSYKTTFRFGDIIPLHWELIFPSDSLDSSHTSVLARMATPVFPVMDNAYIDFYYFFVPMRLVWDHWKEMFGENNVNAWTQTVDYSVPQISASAATGSSASREHTLWDYFGLPCEPSAVPEAMFPSVSALPFRGYRLIWNEWFRNQNVSAPLLINTGDVESDESILDVLQSCRFHDYFSDCLPAPQKGPDTLIPGIANAPIVTTSSASPAHFGSNPLYFRRVDGSNFAPGGYVPVIANPGSTSPSASLTAEPNATVNPDYVGLTPSNLIISSVSPGYTISALRSAFQIQGILERDSRSGSRYTEYLRAAFHTISPDARLQRPEFLGTARMPLNIQQVVQTSSTNSTSPLGETGAYSKTVFDFSVPRHGFTEHGMLFVLATARTERSYQSKVDRKWTCRTRFDFFDPALSHISEQPVYTYELFWDYSSADIYSSPRVFGYHEAWQFLREHPDCFTSSFRSKVSGSLDSWHYGDSYISTPVLSESWMLEGPQQVARTLAVQDASPYDQILMDVFFDWKMTRPIPVHSIPGLVDHF